MSRPSIPSATTTMHKSFQLRSALLAVALATEASVAGAQAVTYTGGDHSVSSLAQMVNAQVARGDFLAAAGNLNVFDFESAIPANLTITGGTTTNNSGCGALCGFNTTTSGEFFRLVEGGAVTFSFTTPVDAFGFFVNGLQTNRVPQQTIVYVDGSSVTRSINMPSAEDGGGAFLGFIAFGQQITSVTFNATNDILGFDDLRFGRSASNPSDPSTSVPEPSTYLLIASGLVGLMARRWHRKIA